MRELKILYSTTDDSNKITYLYDRLNKVLLPIESEKTIDPSRVGFLLKAFFAILKVSNANFEIYKHNDGIFYTYLNLISHNHLYKINCGTELLTCLSEEYTLPINTHTKILDSCGIKITDEVLNECLIE